MSDHDRLFLPSVCYDPSFLPLWYGELRHQPRSRQKLHVQLWDPPASVWKQTGLDTCAQEERWVTTKHQSKQQDL